MTSPRTSQGSRPPFRRGGRRRRQCFCKENTVDYKDVSSIRRFITDRGRIEAGKKSGNCAKCQRNLTTAIKRARHLALLPFAPDHLRVTGSVASSAKIADDGEEPPEDGETTEASTESMPTDGASETAETAETAPTAEADEIAPTAEADETAPTAEVDEIPEAEAGDSPAETESEEPSEDVSTTEQEVTETVGVDDETEPQAEASPDDEVK